MTVTGSLNAPLRTTFPLTSTDAPGLTSSVGASSTEAGRTTFIVTAGRASVRSLPPIFPLAVRTIVDSPERRLDRGIDRRRALGGLLGDRRVAATAKPAGGGRGVTVRAPSAPLGRIDLDRHRAAVAVDDLDRRARRLQGQGRGQGCRGGQAELGQDVRRQRGAGVAPERSRLAGRRRAASTPGTTSGPDGPCARPTTSRSTRSNPASGAAATVNAPAACPAPIGPGRTERPGGGLATSSVIGPSYPLRATVTPIAAEPPLGMLICDVVQRQVERRDDRLDRHPVGIADPAIALEVAEGHDDLGHAAGHGEVERRVGRDDRGGLLALHLALRGGRRVVGRGEDGAVGLADLEHAVERRAEVGGRDVEPEPLAGRDGQDERVLVPLRLDPAVQDDRRRGPERRGLGVGRLAELGVVVDGQGRDRLDVAAATRAPSIGPVNRGVEDLAARAGLRPAATPSRASPIVPPRSSKPIASPRRPPSG